MPKKVKRTKTREHFPETPPLRARTDATFQRVVGTRFEAEKAQILSMVGGLESDMSEMKRLITEPDMEPLKQSQILSTLTGVVSDMSIMKRLITGIQIFNIDLQEEIMKRLPVKSLVRFRSVSKSWKSLIDSSKFIASHKNHPKHLMVEYIETEMGNSKYVSFADNDSFPRLRDFKDLPPFIRRTRIVGTSYGLFCLEGYDSEPNGFRKAAIWNPFIRKSIAIDVRDRFSDGGDNSEVIGFGVCPVAIDPKIVHITHLRRPQERRRSYKCYKQFGKFWKVNVFKLSSGEFRNLSSSSNLPHVSIRIKCISHQVVIDRLIYWCAEEDGTTARNLIMSFDITDERFKAMDLPNSLSSLNSYYLSVSKLRESLVILERNEKRPSYHVWKMDHNGWFTKLFNINAPCGSTWIRVEGFRNTCEPLMSVDGSTSHDSTELVYEPNSKKHSKLLILSYAGSVESYMETLLLMGRSDCISTRF